LIHLNLRPRSWRADEFVGIEAAEVFNLIFWAQLACELALYTCYQLQGSYKWEISGGTLKFLNPQVIREPGFDLVQPEVSFCPTRSAPHCYYSLSISSSKQACLIFHSDEFPPALIHGDISDPPFFHGDSPLSHYPTLYNRTETSPASRSFTSQVWQHYNLSISHATGEACFQRFYGRILLACSLTRSRRCPTRKRRSDWLKQPCYASRFHIIDWSAPLIF
jgi:hypothetical protein